ncbi:MAG: hypothetical protein WC222_03320 [Parachlamydiales bacterium]|jgi:hypothetical protein
MDTIGFFGGALAYATIIFFATTAFLLFFYLMRKGRLDFDESVKYQLFEDENDTWNHTTKK